MVDKLPAASQYSYLREKKEMILFLDKQTTTGEH